ncbi:hypothetical protein [Paenibacillus eucommiae]|uniref:ABC-type glutathione transport system ATPase component n=1 Tax=Paenibacillus eucommiae TaxID=1355755 RepID=A0ABS4JE79_9BACL|nr:hypothetical protein [Paenibacillus eucommiae]MBP1997019.1 ABC-type glutathione transport system ATPase component [Paenibacillus eucommiae]
MDSLLQIKIENLTCEVSCSLFNYWRIVDSISNLSVTFEGGKIYGVVGNLGAGGWGLSYILAGKELMDDANQNSIQVNGYKASADMLHSISCYIGEGVSEHPHKPMRSYPNKLTRKVLGIKTVAEQIEEGIAKSKNDYSLLEIAKMFELSGMYENNEKQGRIHRPLEFQSGEVWRASMAIGFAYGKRLFTVPWMQTKDWTEYIIGEYNKKYIEILRNHNAIVILPVLNESNLGNIADEIILL